MPETMSTVSGWQTDSGSVVVGNGLRAQGSRSNAQIVAVAESFDVTNTAGTPGAYRRLPGQPS